MTKISPKRFKEIIHNVETYKMEFINNYYMWINGIHQKQIFSRQEYKLLKLLSYNLNGYFSSSECDESFPKYYCSNSSHIYISTSGKYVKKIYNKLTEGFLSEVYIYTLLEKLNLSYISPRLIKFGMDYNGIGESYYLIFEFINKNPFCSLSKNNLQDLLNKISILHKLNISHNDIKPDNFIINNSDEVKIIDYEFCNIKFPFMHKNLFMTNHHSPLYAPIEKLTANKIIPYTFEFSHDIWSIGITILEKHLYTLDNFRTKSELVYFIKNKINEDYIKNTLLNNHPDYIILMSKIFIDRITVDNIIKLLTSL